MRRKSLARLFHFEESGFERAIAFFLTGAEARAFGLRVGTS